MSIVLASISSVLVFGIRFLKFLPTTLVLLQNGLLNLFLLMKLNQVAGRKAEAEAILVSLHRKVEGLYKDCDITSLRSIYIQLSNTTVRRISKWKN